MLTTMVAVAFLAVVGVCWQRIHTEEYHFDNRSWVVWKSGMWTLFLTRRVEFAVCLVYSTRALGDAFVASTVLLLD